MIRFRFLSLLFCIAVLPSCSEDEEVWPSVRSDIGLLTTSSAGQAQMFCPDGKGFSEVANGPMGLVPDSTYRVIATYYAQGDQITLTGLQSVMVAFPRRYDTEKNDPLDVVSAWRSDGYVNLRLSVKTRKQTTQYFGVIDRPTDSWPDGRRTAHAALYHDQGGDPLSFSETLYFSLPLSAYDGLLTTGDTLLLHVNTFDEGEKTWAFVL